MLCMCCIFFFKQKTAYEMRISDWSSDVCSSDRHPAREVAEALESEMEARAHRAGQPNLARPLGSHLPVSIRTLATSKTVMPGPRPEPLGQPPSHTTGRASCRESACQSGYSTVGPVLLKKTNINKSDQTH